MKRYLGVMLVAGVLAAPNGAGQSPVDRVAADALVIDRVAEMSKRDLPTELLKRIVAEDIELLRGRRPDGSYEYASYERFEAARIVQESSVQPRSDRMATLEMKGANVYRVIIEVPNRRMLVRRNRPVWVERVDVDYVAEGSTQSRQQSYEVKAWLQPGETRPIDLPVIARQVTVQTIVTADPETGYANVEVALVQARIVDAASSPYADAVTAAKAAQRALEGGEITALRAAALRMRDGLGRGATTTIDVTAERPLPPPPARSTGSDSAARVEMQAELQLIEDLLTGSESERREGLDRLHQLIRRLRP